MKFFWLLILTIFTGLLLRAQDVSVADVYTRFGIAGVKIFCKNSPDTIETNELGEANLDIFPDNKPIVFQHPLYETVIMTKKQIQRHNWIVLMPRGQQLLYAELSLLSAKEYSFGLPFYINIINLDNPLDINDDDQDATEKIMFKTDEKGITIFHSLEPNKILLALDGMRLNNELYKNGKIENAFNFEKTITQNIQQIYDPTYLIYGPDGLGGVIHYFTKIPMLSNSYKTLIHGSTTHRFESSSKSWVSNYQISLASNRFSSYTSVTYCDYGDAVAGHNRQNLPTQDSLYGLHTYFVKWLGDHDTMLTNSNPYRQLGTGYKQLFVMQKFRIKLKSRIFLFSNTYMTHTSGLDIYTSATEWNHGHLRYAAAKYLPTNKIVNDTYIYIQRKTRLFNFASIALSGHYIEEYRYTRKFNNPVGLHQIEKLQVYDMTSDFVKIFRLSRLAYGLEYKYNYLNSHAFFENIISDSTWPGLTRYPTGGTHAHWLSAYASYRNMANSQLIIDLSLRLDYHIVDAKFSNRPPQLPLSFTRVNKHYFAPSIAMAFDAYPIPGWQSKLTLAYNTHIPVVDDFGKVSFKNFVTQIPTDNLKQEKSYYAEFLNSITPSQYVRIQFSIFSTFFRDMIILKDTTLRGQDSLYLGIDAYDLATKCNIPRALIYGISASVNINVPFNSKIIKYMKFSALFNYTKGRNLTDSLPIPNIAPYFGKNSLLVNFGSVTLTLTHLYNGPKPLSQLSPVGEDYIEKASSQGFMAWQILNVRLSYKFHRFNFYVAVNNLFDTFYRPFASSIDGSGRNFIGGIKFSF